MPGMQYKGGNEVGNVSTMGHQLQTFLFQKQALIEVAKEQYFSQLADVTSMPKNMGKVIKKYHYLPLLDDANINDQGLDASGAVIANGNLYGSSKDVGTISGKLPTLTENGGRVNRLASSVKSWKAPSRSSVSSMSTPRNRWTSIRMLIWKSTSPVKWWPVLTR